MANKEKPSTKARREGYAQLHKLKRILLKLIAPEIDVWRPEWLDEDDHWLEVEFSKVGWRDYMVRHMPIDKRGEPDVQKPSKRRRQKQADRNSQVRSGLRR